MIPSLSVVHTVPSRRRNDAPALSSPPKPSDPSSRPGTNHLNPTGTSTSGAPDLRRHAVDDAAAHHGLADGRIRAPVRTMGEEIEDRRRQDMIGIHQARAARHDAVPVGVGVVAEGDVEAVLETDQGRHRVRRRAVHANLAVPVQRHEAERRDPPCRSRPRCRCRNVRQSAPRSATLAPPSGSTPILSRALRMTSMSTTDARSFTYDPT